MINDSPTEFTGVRGSNIRIHCDAVGTPAPDVLWIFGGGVLTMDDVKYEMKEDHSLTVKGVTPDDIGDYVCIARNTISSASKTLSLKIKGNIISLTPLPQQIT